MIKIDSTVQFSFMFPADVATTFAYYSSMERLAQHLKYIELVDSEPENENEYRIYYNTVELGSYHIHVYCDVRMELENGNVIRIIPAENYPPIKTKVTLNSTTARGYYTSEAHFSPVDDHTRVEYSLSLQAQPPRPKGMRFMPGKMVDTIAQNITTHRIKEIADAFIDSSIDQFPVWLAETAV
ncbi:MAG: DUF1997 domain-containing protein [Ardenticatenaceae bacterium]|nr:DUF1997 domain-containing protein [Ardenticatenaceae bacterium]